MHTMPQSKDSSRTKAKAKAADTDAVRPEGDADQPARASLERGQHPVYLVSEDMQAAIDKVMTANAHFAKMSQPHRFEVKFRRGLPVYTQVNTVPVRDVDEAEIERMLATL